VAQGVVDHLDARELGPDIHRGWVARGEERIATYCGDKAQQDKDQPGPGWLAAYG